MPNVVIIGAGEMLTNLIAGCLDSGCKIVGVLRYEKVRYSFLKRILLDTFNQSRELSYIKSLNLYEINANSVNSAEFKKEILKLNVDIILVGTWGEKIKKNIINLPKLATINVHPSILPKYRGPNPYLQAIKHMEANSGITFHLMDENFDTGAILLQKKVEIAPQDTGKELREKIVRLSRSAVTELMNELNSEIIIPIAQDEKHASYFSQISEEEIMLDFSKPAKEICAHIKAFHPWYKCYFVYKNRFFTPNPYKLEILENKTQNLQWGTITDKSSEENSITVLCADNKLLKMQGLKLYGLLSLFTSFYIKFRVKLLDKLSR